MLPHPPTLGGYNIWVLDLKSTRLAVVAGTMLEPTHRPILFTQHGWAATTNAGISCRANGASSRSTYGVPPRVSAPIDSLSRTRETPGRRRWPISRPRQDDRLGGVLLMLGDASILVPPPRTAAADPRTSSRGHVVVAYLEGSPDTASYTTAALADQVWIHPANLGSNGVRANISNYKGALDLLGVNPQVVRRSEYKSGTETFSHHEPSSASLEQVNASSMTA